MVSFLDVGERDAERVRERPTMTSLALDPSPARLGLDLVLEVGRGRAGGRPGSRREAGSCGPGREGDVEALGEHADGDVVQAERRAGGLAHERPLERQGIRTRTLLRGEC